jgi:hypothetical protein
MFLYYFIRGLPGQYNASAKKKQKKDRTGKFTDETDRFVNPARLERLR